jgi:hypothetical protein
MIGNIQGVDMVIENHDGFEVCTVWEDPKQHDARLIAAAPDLLEALCKLAELYDAMGVPRGGCRIMAEAAINKAIGETK